MENVNLKWDAKLYQDNSNMQFALGMMALSRLNPRNNEHILEIGCGNARLAIEIAKIIPEGKITCIELSEEMVKQARINLSKQGIKNVEIIHSNAIKINYENEFNAVFSNSAIHWIKDQEQIYRLIYKALKNGGRIIIQTGLKSASAFMQTFFIVGNEFKEFLTNFKLPWHFLTVKETEAILKKSQFNDIFIEKYRHSTKFENEEKLINYCRAAGFVPFFNVIPAHLHDKFTQRFKDVLFKINQPNPLSLTMERLFISAKKLC